MKPQFGLIKSGFAVPLPAAEFFPGSGWERAEPEELARDRAKIESARDYALTGGGSGHIVYKGKLMLSWGAPTTHVTTRSPPPSPLALRRSGLR